MTKGSYIVINCDKEPSPQYKYVLHFVDILISSFIISPLVIAFWRGGWNLFDFYLIPSEPVQSGFASMLISLIGYMIFMLPQKIFCDIFDREKHRLTFYVFSRLYTFIFGLISILGCRGPWHLADHLTPGDLTTVNLLTLLAVLLMIITRSLANLSAPPFLVSTDDSDDYFLINTRFKISATQHPFLYILDCLFSSLVIGTLGAIVWRGVWVFCDLALFPENEELSAWVSLIGGYCIAAITFACEPITRHLCDKIDGYWRLAVADVFLFYSFLGTVSIWRGVWMLLDFYFIPDNEIVSNWMCLLVPFVILVLLNCSNSNLVRGVFIDAEEPSGKCVVFPIHYIRLVFRKQRSKKHRYLIHLLGEQDQNKNMLVVLAKNPDDLVPNVIQVIPSMVLDVYERSEKSAIKNYYASASSVEEGSIQQLI